MQRFVIRRLALLAPMLVATVVAGFLLLQAAPQDPLLERLLGAAGNRTGIAGPDIEAQYRQRRASLGLDKPVFYFSLATWAEPDTLHRVPFRHQRRFLKMLLAESGNWEAAQDLYAALNQFAFIDIDAHRGSAHSDSTEKIKIWAAEAFHAPDIRHLQLVLDSIQAYAPLAENTRHAMKCRLALNALLHPAHKWKNWLPSIHWQGFDNQFHAWFLKVLRLDFGTSSTDGEAVARKIGRALVWTLLLSSIAVLITICLSFRIGVWLALRHGKRRVAIVSALLFGLHALPAFWVAMLLVHIFANPENLDWFPAQGVQSMRHSAEWPVFLRLSDWAWHLALPIVVLCYGGLAYLARQVQQALVHEAQSKAYIRTGWAKGLKPTQIFHDQAFPNALLPLITLAGGLLPGLVGGSVVLETLFDIPGMGLLSLQAILTRDYPLVVAIFTLLAFLTLLGNFLADILYAWADPRIMYAN